MNGDELCSMYNAQCSMLNVQCTMLNVMRDVLWLWLNSKSNLFDTFNLVSSQTNIDLSKQVQYRLSE